MDSMQGKTKTVIISFHTHGVCYREEVVYDCCGNVSFPSLYFHIWMSRESLYYIVNIITPCIILSMLAWLGGEDITWHNATS